MGFLWWKKSKVEYEGRIPHGVVGRRNEYQYLYSNVLEPVDKVMSDNGLDFSMLPNLLQDSHIYSCVQSRKSAILSMNYELMSDNEEKKQFLMEIYESLNFRKILSSILDATLYGYKVFELFWEFRNGKIYLIDAIAKPNHWFKFDTKGRLLYVPENGETQLVPANKFLVVQNNASYENPYGEGVLSKCFLPYVYKKGATKLFSELVEKFGIPFLIGTADTNISLEDLEKFNTMLQEAKQSFTFATNSSFQVSSLPVDRTSASDLFQTFLFYQNSEISKAILSQTLTTEQSLQGGSNALGNTQYNVFSQLTESDKVLTQETVNQLNKIIIDLNYSDKDFPKIRLYKEEDIDMNLAQRDQILSTQIKFKKDYYIREYGLLEEDFDIVEQTTPQFAEKPLESPKNVKLDGLNEYARNVIELSLSKIENGTSYAEIEEAIYELYPGLTNNEVSDYLGTAIQIAMAGGKLDATTRN